MRSECRCKRRLRLLYQISVTNSKPSLGAACDPAPGNLADFLPTIDALPWSALINGYPEASARTRRPPVRRVAEAAGIRTARAPGPRPIAACGPFWRAACSRKSMKQASRAVFEPESDRPGIGAGKRSPRLDEPGGLVRLASGPRRFPRQPSSRGIQVLKSLPAIRCPFSLPIDCRQLGPAAH